jgi:nitrite reductase (NADH) small subunit
MGAAGFIEAGPLERFPARIGVRVKLADEEVAVFRLTDGRVFALENKNPHRKGGIISEGMVSGEYLYDPLYDWKISLVTGQVQAPDSGQVKIYPVKVENGHVSIGISSSPEGECPACTKNP